MTGRVRRALEGLSAAMAIAGGIVLSLAAIFAVGAILLSAANRPVLGDTEIMEFAAAAAIASFLPWAQMRNAHVKITVFTDRLPTPLLMAIDAISRVAFALVATVLAWRLAVGGIDAFGRTRMTMFLELPLWAGYLLAGIPMALWVVVTWFLALEAMLGRNGRPSSQPDRGFEEVGP
ncbi:MAG: TRAP transporter small permease subunit [Pseudomonadota bacterium]